MAREVEIKLRVKSPAAARRKVLGLGYRPATRRLLERSVLLDTAYGMMRKSRQLLRLRSKNGEWWLTLKGPCLERSRYKSRQEIDLKIAQGELLAGMLERAGFRPAFEYEKYRTEFLRRGQPGKVLLDETPVGNFLELEGPPEWIESTAAALGYTRRDYIRDSYMGLHFRFCQENGIPMGDMTFAKVAGARRGTETRGHRGQSHFSRT